MKLKSLYAIVIAISLLTSSCQEDDPMDLLQTSEPLAEQQLHSSRICLSHEHTLHLLNDPAYRSLHEQKINAFGKIASRSVLKAACASPVLVPVAIHFQRTNNANVGCLRSLAIDQINRLNQDFSGTNSDISRWSQVSGSYNGISNGEMCVRFVIADQNHPSGYGLSNGDPAITVDRTQGDFDSNWSGYLNIFIMPNSGSLGYAPLGGTGSGDGVVIDAVAFGAGSGCGNVRPEGPFDLGRTLTHEVGHYFLLDHIWGNGCSTDDEVADTPDQADSYGGCPNVGERSCGSVDLHMSYMDYTNDACMYMFSAGQVSKMTNYLSASLSNLTNNTSSVFSGGQPTSDNPTDNPDPVEEEDPIDEPADPVDDVDDNTAVCTAPPSSNVSVQNPTSVVISWSAVSGASRYQVQYRIPGASWTRRGTRVNNLQEEVYEYRLRSRCDDGWTSWSTIDTFDLSQNDGDDEPTQGGSSSDISIILTLDDYGSENTWELYDQQGRLISQAGPFRDGRAGRKEIKTIEDLADGCYEMDLFDAFGDGICCEYGDGNLEIQLGGRRIAHSDGRFGSYELIQFCIENGAARIKKISRDAKVLGRNKK